MIAASPSNDSDVENLLSRLAASLSAQASLAPSDDDARRAVAEAVAAVAAANNDAASATDDAQIAGPARPDLATAPAPVSATREVIAQSLISEEAPVPSSVQAAPYEASAPEVATASEPVVIELPPIPVATAALAGAAVTAAVATSEAPAATAAFATAHRGGCVRPRRSPHPRRLRRRYVAPAAARVARRAYARHARKGATGRTGSPHVRAGRKTRRIAAFPPVLEPPDAPASPVSLTPARPPRTTVGARWCHLVNTCATANKH